MSGMKVQERLRMRRGIALWLTVELWKGAGAWTMGYKLKSDVMKRDIPDVA